MVGHSSPDSTIAVKDQRTSGISMGPAAAGRGRPEAFSQFTSWNLPDRDSKTCVPVALVLTKGAIGAYSCT